MSYHTVLRAFGFEQALLRANTALGFELVILAPLDFTLGILHQGKLIYNGLKSAAPIHTLA